MWKQLWTSLYFDSREGHSIKSWEEGNQKQMRLSYRDPDREGEAISWHLAHLLGLDLRNEPIRVEFNEITKDAIKEAFKNLEWIDMDLVDAQQARHQTALWVTLSLFWRKWKKDWVLVVFKVSW